MDAILHTFGIDWRLLLVNAINFGLLLAGLTFFLYKPLGKMLEERRTKVAKGVEDAHAAEVTLQQIESSRAERLAQAGREADTIVSEARDMGASKAKEIVSLAEGTAARALRDAEAQAAELKRGAIAESKEEVARMIVLGIEKLAKQSK
jgi:F-type H+-transporting ATPase subunit b